MPISSSRRALSPVAWIPSSLVIRTRTRTILGRREPRSRSRAWPRGGRVDDQERRLTPSLQRHGLATAVRDDHLGGHAQEDPRADHQQAELPVAELAHRAPDLADHVEDGARGDRVEEKLERLGGDVVADDRAEEDGTPADEAGE